MIMIHAVAQDMAARTGDLLTTATANTVRIDQMEAAVSAQTASVNAAVNTLTTAVNTQLNTATTDLDSRIAAATLSISEQMRGFQTGINASSSTLASSLTASVSRSVAATTAGLAEMSSTMTAGITQMNTSMTRGLASKVGMAEVQPYMWVGGCTRHANRSVSASPWCLTAIITPWICPAEPFAQTRAPDVDDTPSSTPALPPCDR